MGVDINILVTNDDGVHAPGLAALREAMSPLGTTCVVAPDRQQSATSHSLTLHRPLHVEQLGDRVHSVDGTPTDCVLLAVHGLLRERPRLVVSGINHGPNMGEDTMYSGTVAAAMEGAILGIPSIAFSLVTREAEGPHDFRAAASFATTLADRILKTGLPPHTVLNVNIPNSPGGEIAGVRVTRLGKRIYQDSIVERVDPDGTSHYWIAGEATWEVGANTDFSAVDCGMISITPLHFDLTDYKAIDDLRIWAAGLETGLSVGA